VERFTSINRNNVQHRYASAACRSKMGVDSFQFDSRRFLCLLNPIDLDCRHDWQRSKCLKRPHWDLAKKMIASIIDGIDVRLTRWIGMRCCIPNV
jgi:hypothetical protein